MANTLKSGLASVDDLSANDIEAIFSGADRFRVTRRSDALRNWVVSPMFFQPSTRTRLGFEVASLRSGALVSGFSDPNTTRVQESTSETFEDTIRAVSAMSDLLVLRSGERDAARRAAAIASCPVVNAGDRDEHPTQALIDAYAMRALSGAPHAKLDVGFTGCVSNRCTTPLIKVLARLGVASMTFLLEPGREPEPTSLAEAERHGVRTRHVESLDTLLSECDVVSAAPRDTRFIRDPSHAYPAEATTTLPAQVIDAEAIRRTGSKALVMHPLPRRNEISTDVDYLPNAAYFKQVGLAVYLRMAVLERIAQANSAAPGLVAGGRRA